MGALSRLGPASQCGGVPLEQQRSWGGHWQSGALWQDQRCWDQVGSKPQREDNLQSYWARMGLNDFAHYDLNCPGNLPLAGASAPPAQPPLQKHLLWQQKATLLVLKDQQFLQLIQVISHISKTQQPCGLDLCMPVGT